MSAKKEKNKKLRRFHKKKGFCTVPAPAKILHNLEDIQEMRILDLEGKWIMTFHKVEPPPESKVWEADKL